MAATRAATEPTAWAWLALPPAPRPAGTCCGCRDRGVELFRVGYCWRCMALVRGYGLHGESLRRFLGRGA